MKLEWLKPYQFKKGQPSYNKGKHFSAEIRRKMSIAKKGKPNPKLSEVRKRLFAEGILIHPKPMLGKHHTIETIERIRIGNIGKINKHSKEGNERIAKYMRNRIVSEETKMKVSRTRKEKEIAKLQNNPRWKGGISFEPYTPEFNKYLKEKIRKRDEFSCQICGLKENSKRHAVHHIDYDKSNCKENNLITLCKRCHDKTNINRKQWQEHFEEVYRNNDVKIFKVV
jgi:hypothetical protein